jgi:hypothetical protein
MVKKKEDVSVESIDSDNESSLQSQTEPPKIKIEQIEQTLCHD